MVSKSTLGANKSIDIKGIQKPICIRNISYNKYILANILLAGIASSCKENIARIANAASASASASASQKSLKSLSKVSRITL